MVEISVDEKKMIREAFPEIHIVRTMKQKSKRGRYYCEEDRKAMKFLRNLRESAAVR